MTIYADIQHLEPGSLVELFELDATALGADVLRFHGYTQVGPMYWQGLQYDPWPIQASGFELNPSKPPSPTLSVANIDGTIGALCRTFSDFCGAVVTRHRTLGRYMDAANFPGGNPSADPTQELPPDKWIIERRSSETNIAVEFELSSALDFGQQQLPGRQIVANVCGWLARGGYRGPYCGYTGGPVADINDNPTSDPAKDQCSGRLNACQMRFGTNNPLPYGSFPAAGLLRT